MVIRNITPAGEAQSTLEDEPPLSSCLGPANLKSEDTLSSSFLSHTLRPINIPKNHIPQLLRRDHPVRTPIPRQPILRPPHLPHPSPPNFSNSLNRRDILRVNHRDQPIDLFAIFNISASRTTLLLPSPKSTEVRKRKRKKKKEKGEGGVGEQQPPLQPPENAARAEKRGQRFAHVALVPEIAVQHVDHFVAGVFRPH